MKDRSFVIVAVCFFLSGFAALIYETAWTREFSFVFGTSELAVATVLAAYMAGLAGGAAVGGRIAERTERALSLYGFLELGVGVAALLVPVALAGATQLLVVLFGGQSEFAETNPLAISSFYLITTFLIVMVPTGFMGATLPLLSRHAVKRDSEVGSKIGALYSINTVGAVAGTLTAAFVLLPRLGIRETVYVAVAVNALVFLVAMVLVRVARLESKAAEPDAVPSTPPITAAPRRIHFIQPLMLVSGALSFTYEVLWVRLLSQMVGGGVYGFATMLASFLLGIALGSGIASRLATTRDRSLRFFVAAQVGIAVLTAIAFRAIDKVPALAKYFDVKMSLSFDVAVAGLILLPSAVCIGATFPLAVRIVAKGSDDAGPASARVYSWNTVGAIIGSIGAAFVLLPELGFRSTIVLGICTNLTLAGLALFFGSEKRKAIAIPVVVAIVLVLLLPGEPWQMLLSSPLHRNTKQGKIDFFSVGRGATVLVTADSPTRWRLSTNGLPESMIASDAEPPGQIRIAVLLGQLGPMLRPQAKSMMVVGLGGGVTVEDIPRNIERIDVIELEEEVVAANRWLSERRAVDPLSDPRIHVHVNDARSALFLTDQKFDVIAAQASHPWTGGAAHLYTGEFFKLISDHLTDEGVFVQWIGRTFVDVPLVKTLVRTLHQHFKYVHVYKEILFVSSNSPLPDRLDLEALLAQDPGFSERTGIYQAEDLASFLLMDAETSREFATDGQLTSDDRNLLQMRSPLLRRAPEKQAKRSQRAINEAYHQYDPLPRLIADKEVNPVHLIQRVRAYPQVERARNLAKNLEDPIQKERLRLLKPGNTAGRLGLEAFLTQHPDDSIVRAALLRHYFKRIGVGPTTTLPEFVGGYTDKEQIVTKATLLHRRANWSGLQAIDDQLAEVTPVHPLYIEAAILRIDWRIATGDSVRGTEAVKISSDAYLATNFQHLLILRARAAVNANQMDTAIASLARINQKRGGQATNAVIRGQVRDILHELDVTGPLDEWRNRLLATTFRERKK
jgi:spermidine synthase